MKMENNLFEKKCLQGIFSFITALFKSQIISRNSNFPFKFETHSKKVSGLMSLFQNTKKLQWISSKNFMQEDRQYQIYNIINCKFIIL